VLAQDFGDFELLLIDDGSTDSSTAIARRYETSDPRIRYFEHPGHANRGMSATRNLGLSMARGEFVAFIDADDRWRKSKLAEQVELLDRLPGVDAIGGAVNYWKSHSGGEDRIIPTGHVRGRPIPPGEATLALYPLGKADAPSMSDLMLRRESIARVGGFEEKFENAYEDQAFLAKLYLNSTLYFTDAIWSDYRLHDRSCMAQVKRHGSYHDARRAFLMWFENYVDLSTHRDDEQLRRALKRALRPYQGVRARFSDIARSIPFAVPVVRAVRGSIRRLRPMIAPGPAILMYHRIAEERFDPWSLAVSPANFDDQLQWISRNRTPLPLDEFVELNREGKLPRNAIAVTFDDGYACNFQTALPSLQRFGIPATIFISPDLIDRGDEFWWDDLERIVLAHDGETLRIDSLEVALGERHDLDSEWPAGAPARTPRQQAYQRIWSLLYDKTPLDTRDALNQLREQAGVPAHPRDSHRPLTAAEIAAMPDIVAFGSHALSHPSLPQLPAGEQEREISDSVSRCQALTGERPRTFAYPYGDYDPALEQLVERAGFLCACLAEGLFVRRDANAFALPRVFVGDWDSARLARQLGRP
jgi:peptidoglycan/xylan/chitin deacetylase (PgdA/CDA1 family)/glycosyltransferase involved in cell wall biosynthesis